jgi:hypothetical protein
MLPGNGTILLESIANINSSLKERKDSSIISSTQQIQLILGKLIKLCDDALISDDEETFITLNKESIKEYVEELNTCVSVNGKKNLKFKTLMFPLILEYYHNCQRKETSGHRHRRAKIKWKRSSQSKKFFARYYSKYYKVK